MFTKSKRVIATLAIIGMFSANVAWADYTPSTQAMETQRTQDQRSEISTLLDRSEVRDALQAHGVSPEEAQQRLAQLSPTQIDQLKTQLDTMPAGEGAVGAIIGAALIVFLVLLFTDIIDETDVYDFDDGM